MADRVGQKCLQKTAGVNFFKQNEQTCLYELIGIKLIEEKL